MKGDHFSFSFPFYFSFLSLNALCFPIEFPSPSPFTACQVDAARENSLHICIPCKFHTNVPLRLQKELPDSNGEQKIF